MFVLRFASEQDATKLRHAEEPEAIERLLLMEVDHRSMNALALVESFLSLTQADDLSGFSDAVRDRVGAIASAQRLLSESIGAADGSIGGTLNETLTKHGVTAGLVTRVRGHTGS